VPMAVNREKCTRSLSGEWTAQRAWRMRGPVGPSAKMDRSPLHLHTSDPQNNTACAAGVVTARPSQSKRNSVLLTCVNRRSCHTSG